MIVQTHIKVNLGLHVLRKRPDGYHDLETLFLPCHAYGDTLEIIPGDAYSETSGSIFSRYGEENLSQAISEDGKLMITIARAEGIGWDPLEDLTAKAWRLLAADFDLPPVKIFLEKKAPVGAGLGGGSADAAFALNMLNALFGLGLATGIAEYDGVRRETPSTGKTLADYAALLGSDCTFFLYNRPMIGMGRGEILEEADDCVALAPEPDCLLIPGAPKISTEYAGAIPTDSTKKFELKVVVPEGISVSTAEAYRGIVPRGARTDGSPSPSLREILAQPVERWKELLENDFEETVFKSHPELAAIKQSLYDSGAVYASMSGSGSALFALYRV